MNPEDRSLLLMSLLALRKLRGVIKAGGADGATPEQQQTAEDARGVLRTFNDFADGFEEAGPMPGLGYATPPRGSQPGPGGPQSPPPQSQPAPQQHPPPHGRVGGHRPT